MSPEEFKAMLLSLDPAAVDFPLAVDRLIDQVDVAKHEILIEHIFELFERHPAEELGAPGSLVHFVESFYPTYVPRLIRSLNASPNASAVLMINRILNSDLGVSERSEYLGALAAVKANAHVHPDARALAEHFMEFQAKREQRSS